MKEEYISIRCTKQVKDFLGDLAKKEDRSLSSQVMFMLKQTSRPLEELMQKPAYVGSQDPNKPVLHQDHA